MPFAGLHVHSLDVAQNGCQDPFRADQDQNGKGRWDIPPAFSILCVRSYTCRRDEYTSRALCRFQFG